ncbi:MAG: hypothetical protein ACLFPL_03385 [Candidatus Nanoarchaeia archaeon]
MKHKTTYSIHQLHRLKYADMEIESIIKLILIGIGLIIAFVIITSIFNQDVSEGMDRFFNILP